MPQNTVRKGSSGEPDANTYVITVILADIKKVVALEIDTGIRNMIECSYGGDVDGVFVTTSHVKASSYSDLQPVGESIRPVTG